MLIRKSPFCGTMLGLMLSQLEMEPSKAEYCLRICLRRLRDIFVYYCVLSHRADMDVESVICLPIYLLMLTILCY